MRVLFLLPLLLGGPSCTSDCLGDQCPGVPDEPWDPDDGVSEDQGYGYGSGGEGQGGETGTGTGGTTETTTERGIVSVRDCDVTLTWAGAPPDAVTVEVAGEFNGWVPAPLTANGDGTWSRALGEVPPGVHAFQYVVDGVHEGQPPINVYTKWSGGVEHRALRVGDCHRPLLQTVSASGSADGRVQAVVQFASPAEGTPIDPAAVEVTVGDLSVEAAIDVPAGTIRVDVTGLPPGKHSVRVRAADTAGVRAENEPLFIPLWVEDEPFAWQDAILYFVFTDRYRSGDAGDELYGPVDGVPWCGQYQGGDFLGARRSVEDGYFDELGVGALWLSPVYDNPSFGYGGDFPWEGYSGFHGYWPIAPMGVEERWGDADGSGEDRLKELIDAAHARGIRVLFDVVLNHVHEDHPYIDEHPEWFEGGCVCGDPGCGWDDVPVECWFQGYLPDLNYKEHAIVERVLDDHLAMIADYDVDGLRVDAAKHMDHVIMRTLRKRLGDEVEAGGGAPFWLVGETFTGDRGLVNAYVGDHELHGQFDFPLYYTIRSVFAGGGSFRELDASVADSAAVYGDALMDMSPFLGNHDIERFATAVTGEAGDCWSESVVDPMAEGGDAITQRDLIDRASLGFAFTLTQPGVPLIYYGDEIGLHGGGDPDNRRMMMFDPDLSANQRELLGRVRAIGRARAASTALRRGSRVTLWVDDDLYIYARDAGGGDVALVALNKGDGPRTESVDVSALGVDGARFDDALGSGVGGTVSAGRLSLTVGAWQHALLVRP